MGKRTLYLLLLLLGLAAVLRADLSFSVSLLSSQAVKTFTAEQIWNKEPQPSFRDTLLVLSSFQPGRQEFLIFGDIITGKGVSIENGLWDTRKASLGVGVGKVLSIPISLKRLGTALALDFSAGPFLCFFLSNRYTFVAGEYKKEVESAGFLRRVQYGLYGSARLRLEKFKELLNGVDVLLGLHFSMPFSNHEFSDDPKARHILYKTFFFAGIAF
jgi:hypothetical protein